MNVWSGLEKKVKGRGRGRRTKLRTTATTVVGEAWPLGLDMMGGVRFLFFSSDWVGLDWIESDWTGVARRRWEEWQ